MESEPNKDKEEIPQMEISENKTDTPKPTCNNRVKSFFTYFTIEPFLFCYIMPSIISAITTQQFNVRKACRVDLNNTDDLCNKVADSDLSENETYAAFIASQKLVANMATWSLPLQYGIPAIMILFIGAWSDRTGNRKALMLVPMIGEIVSTAGLLLGTYYFSSWPLFVIGLIESLPTALSGGLSVAIMGSYSYIADVTSPESRTFRMGLVGVIVTLGVPLGSSLGGVLTEKCGYYGVYSTILGFYLIGLFYTIVRVKNVRKNKTGTGNLYNGLMQFFDKKNIMRTASVMFKDKKRLVQIILIILAHVVIMGPVFGESSVLYLYFTKKFKMDVVGFSFYSTYSVLMGIAGTAVAVSIFCKLLKIHDACLGIIGACCKVMSSLMYGLAPTIEWFYSGPALDFFGGTGAIAIRSLGTKLVDPDDVGKFCSILGLFEGVGPVIYGPLYNKIYSATLEDEPGTFYIVGSIMTVPAIFIFIYLFIVLRKSEKDVVTNPNEKELHAHDNFVTVL